MEPTVVCVRPPGGRSIENNGWREPAPRRHDREDLMKILTTSVVAGIGLMALACGSSPQPTERLATAQAAVRAAKEVGAKDVPQAQLHAQLAEEQVTQAQKMIEDG